MKKLLGITIIFLSIVFSGNCSPGDLNKVDKQVERFFEIKKKGNYEELSDLIHSNATSDVNPNFFREFNAQKKQVLGSYISHERDKFSYNASGGNKTFSVTYKVKYSKVDPFWERFVFRNDSDGAFRIVGYISNTDKSKVEEKK